MNNQGRLINAILLLAVSMTAGTFILLAFEGKPFKPVAFSLSSSSEINTTVSRATVGTKDGITQGKWKSIEITYSTSLHEIQNSRTTGNLNIKNHFVICDGTSGCVDGQILATTTWYNQMPIQDALFSKDTIRICIISPSGQFKPTPWQSNRLESLVNCLVKHCNIPMDQIRTVK